MQRKIRYALAAIIVAGLAAVVFAGTAGAARSYGTGDLRVVCNDGETVTFYGGQSVLWSYLEEHEGATVGPCEEEQPPPPVIVPDDFGQTFLCMSHFGGFPVAFDWADVTHELAAGWFVPAAVAGAGVGPQDVVGGYHLVCNTAGLAATGTGLNGSGGAAEDLMGAADWKLAVSEYGVPGNGSYGPVNHYAIYK